MLVIATDHLLKSLAKEARFYEEFPFLKAAPMERRVCRCEGRNEIIMSPNTTWMKRQILALAPEKAAKLKKMLHADELKVILPGDKGKPTIHVL